QNLLCAEGQFRIQPLLKSADFTGALRTMKEGEFLDQSADQFIKICHDLREGLPESCSVTVDGAKEFPSLVVLYKPDREGASSSSDFRNPWQVAPQTERVQTRHLQNVAPLGRILLTSLIPWNPNERTLDGWGEVIGNGDVEFRWKGRFVGGELSHCGSLYIGKSREAAIVFDDQESGSHMPLSLLPVIADLLGTKLQGHHPFSARVWCETNTWPPAGFEGFINHFESGQYSFSGYMTSTGRAIGIMGNLRPGNSPFFSVHTGNFRILGSGLFPAPPLSVDEQPRQLLGCQVGENTQLVPHGLVQEMMIMKSDHAPITRIDRLYFCGQGITVTEITQDPELAYRAPNQSACLVGFGYTDQQKPIHLNMVFNPGDGGEDFVKVKPDGFEQQVNHRELYVDASGTVASWVLINQECKMGEIHFPCGLKYSGQVTTSQHFHSFQGQGKISFGELSLSGRFQPDGTVSDLQAKNTASQHWLSSYSRPSLAPRFRLNELLELMSGGEISYQADIHPHLQVRGLGMMAEQAVVFSPQ
ncbi:MAG TPA: hypothetical protein VFV28_03645, partial [Limnobacter sp.]|nr:hypothetical protein [Limnobacter sp.]